MVKRDSDPNDGDPDDFYAELEGKDAALTQTFHVPDDSEYTLTLRVATPAGMRKGTFSAYLDGKRVLSKTGASKFHQYRIRHKSKGLVKLIIRNEGPAVGSGGQSSETIIRVSSVQLSDCAQAM